MIAIIMIMIAMIMINDDDSVTVKAYQAFLSLVD